MFLQTLSVSFRAAFNVQNIALGNIEKSHDLITNDKSIFLIRIHEHSNKTLLLGNIVLFPDSDMVTIDQVDKVFLNPHFLPS